MENAKDRLKYRSNHNDFDTNTNCLNNERMEINNSPNNFDYIKLENLQEHKPSVIDLIDISKCILEPEDEKINYNNFSTICQDPTMKTERASDEFVSIEAIKRYLNDASIEFTDLNIDHCSSNY